MATFSIDSSASFKARVSYTVKQNIAGNSSVVTITGLEILSNSFYGSSYWLGTISINSTPVCSLTYTNTNICGAALVVGQYVPVGNVSGTSGAIVHAANGSKTISATVAISGISSATGARFGSVSGTVSVSLPAIPRASSITATGGELGSAITIKLAKASSGFTDTVSYTCGSASGTIVSGSTASSVKWTPPLELARQAPNGTSVTITLTTATASGGKAIGSSEIRIKCTLPAAIVPTIDSIGLSDTTGYSGTYGGYVQNQSVLRVKTQASGAYGSTISSISVTCGKTTASGASVSFSLPSSGTVTLSVTVKDSRGRKVSSSTSISVVAYKAPTVSVTDASRCIAGGTLQPDGPYGKVVFAAKVTSLSGKNTAQYILRRRQRGASQWTDTVLPQFANQLSPSAASVMFAAAIDKAYEVRVEVTDNFTSVQSDIATLPVAFALLDFHSAAKAIGLGQRANTAETVSIGLPVKMLGNPITDVGAPSRSTDAATKAYADGKIQMSLLWSNASSSSAMGGSSSSDSVEVKLDLSGYSWAMCIFRAATNSSVLLSPVMVPVGNTGVISLINSITDSSSQVSYARRTFSTSATAVTFASCRTKAATATAVGTNNTYLIPVRIFGIKGVT